MFKIDFFSRFQYIQFSVTLERLEGNGLAGTGTIIESAKITKLPVGGKTKLYQIITAANGEESFQEISVVPSKVYSRFSNLKHFLVCFIFKNPE